MFFSRHSMKRKSIGNNAEQTAKTYLQQQGLHFIDKNVSCRSGEIDLIVKDEQTLVFVEVRYRKDSRYGHAFETVNEQKQRKIIAAARYYLHKHKLTESIRCRFDVIRIEQTTDTDGTALSTDRHNMQNHTIHWIKDAFYAD